MQGIRRTQEERQLEKWIASGEMFMVTTSAGVESISLTDLGLEFSHWEDSLRIHLIHTLKKGDQLSSLSGFLSPN